MKQRLPDVCDFCGKEIKSELQYASEWFQGKSTFGENRIRAKIKADCCHPCFVEICKTGYKPTWIKEHRNPQYVAGSKKAAEKYFVAVEETEQQTIED